MEKKGLISPNELEIKLSFHNYKLLKKEEFNLKGSFIYFVKGPNEVGKSTILQALKAAQEIKDETPRKVTIGESEGVNEFTLPGADGRMYNVIYQFTDSTTKFVVFDDEGNKISKIGDMRNIFKYNHIDATSFINWSYTAEGRRKQKELILKLLPVDHYIKYAELEDHEKDLFDRRTAINKTIEINDKLRSEYELTTEELKIQKNFKAAEEQLASREESYNKLLQSGNELDKVLYDLQYIDDNINRCKSIITEIEDEIIKLQTTLKEHKEKEASLIKEFKTKTEEYNNLNEKQKNIDAEKEKLYQSVLKGREYVSKAKEYTGKLTKYNEANENYHKAVSTAENLTEDITTTRIAKEEIITEAEFSVSNLSFDEEGYLTINNLRFDEKQTCESDTILIVAQLMCKMNESPIQIIGDASLLDFKKLDKLYKIAEENGKIMFVDEIDRSLDKLVIVGYEKETKEKPQTNPLF